MSVGESEAMRPATLFWVRNCVTTIRHLARDESHDSFNYFGGALARNQVTREGFQNLRLVLWRLNARCLSPPMVKDADHICRLPFDYTGLSLT